MCAVEILRSCRRAMPAGGTLLVVEPVLPARVDSPAVTGTVLSDINMLVNTGGRERTEEEFRALYNAAAFELTAVMGEGTDYRVLEVSPV